jgi:hypothetical protein
VSGDGQRFLVVEAVGQTGASPIILAVNWDAELPKP